MHIVVLLGDNASLAEIEIGTLSALETLSGSFENLSLAAVAVGCRLGQRLAAERSAVVQRHLGGLLATTAERAQRRPRGSARDGAVRAAMPQATSAAVVAAAVVGIDRRIVLSTDSAAIKAQIHWCQCS